jgi:hypothetical protein
VHFSKGLCSVCGIEQVSDEELKEQGCSGNHAKKWAACPLCVGGAAHGLKASSVRKSKMQSTKCKIRALRLRTRVPPRHHLTTANDL